VPFLKINISKDSVGTRFGCGEIFNNSFIADFPKSLLLKNFENSLTIDKVIDRAWCTTFWDTVYICCHLCRVMQEYFDDYPKHVLLILANEFCERFSYYGLRGARTWNTFNEI